MFIFWMNQMKIKIFLITKSTYDDCHMITLIDEIKF